MKIQIDSHADALCDAHASKMCDGFPTRSFKSGQLQNHDVYKIGKLGEYAAGMWLKHFVGAEILHRPFRDAYKYPHPNDDFIVRIGKQLRQLEVKTKARSVDPQPHFECCTDSIKPHQTYVFVSYNRNTCTADILGFLTESKMRQVAKPVLRGSENCNFEHKANEYNVTVSQLYPPNQLEAVLTSGSFSGMP